MKVDGIDPLVLNKVKDQPRNEVQQAQKGESDLRIKQREDVLGKLTASPESKTFLEEMEEGLNKINDTADAFNLSLRFRLHQESERWMVQIYEVENEEVIKEIPPEQVLNVIAQIQELFGILLDERL